MKVFQLPSDKLISNRVACCSCRRRRTATTARRAAVTREAAAAIKAAAVAVAAAAVDMAVAGAAAATDCAQSVCVSLLMRGGRTGGRSCSCLGSAL